MVQIVKLLLVVTLVAASLADHLQEDGNLRDLSNEDSGRALKWKWKGP